MTTPPLGRDRATDRAVLKATNSVMGTHCADCAGCARCGPASEVHGGRARWTPLGPPLRDRCGGGAVRYGAAQARCSAACGTAVGRGARLRAAPRVPATTVGGACRRGAALYEEAKGRPAEAEGSPHPPRPLQSGSSDLPAGHGVKGQYSLARSSA